MSSPYYEIVAYTVDRPGDADTSRSTARELLQAFPGFIAWTPFSGAGDRAARVDLVAWRSLGDARAAAEVVASDPAFAAFRASISHVAAMGHYTMAPCEPHPVVAGNGLEIGRFRLKPGVSEEQLRLAYAAMVEQHLAGQAGWRRQHLVKLGDGRFVDLAFAETRARSESICASWEGQPQCAAFLALIEPESMEFATVL